MSASKTCLRLTRGRTRGAMARLAVLALLVAVPVIQSAPARAAGGGGGGGALVTVGNGITTTDLNAVGMTPAALASSLVGTGVTVSNVTFSGDNAQAGALHVVDPSVVSFNDGLIMSSGNVADVVGPNKSDGITGAMNGPADADLNALIANTMTVNPVTFDAASLEFDFVPTASTIYFTYTFGSDEYLEWVNLFNDVFAFFVNGQNCATAPDGSPITIDTINNAVNPNLFRDNSFSSPPANPINIESDGLSVELICTAHVNPGVTNHMKLAIADTSDPILDSVVMIKAGSLSTTPPESCNDGVDNDDDLKVDMEDTQCQATTTPPPTGSGGIGSGGNAPPFTGNEGTPITLDASALDWQATPDTVSTSWTVTGINGTTGTCEVVPPGRQPLAADGSIAVVTAICPNEGEYVARVDGWDVENSSAFDKDVDFFVHNAPPVVSIDAPTMGAQVSTGANVALSASVADPGASDSVTCEITWGDGTSQAGTMSGGSCNGSHAYADTGQQLVSVTATDDAGDSAAAATMVEVTASATTVTSSANPSVTGQPVALVAHTTAGTTGSMSFYDGATLLTTKSVSAGSATYTTAKLGVGTHTITVSYKKTSLATPSVSEALVQVVQPAATTTSLSSSVEPSVVGQTVAVKATVAPTAPGAGSPTGTVDFYDNGTYVATKSLSTGKATLSVRPTVGEHTYSATYSGSASFDPSSSTASLGQTVLPAATTTTLTSSLSPSVFGQSVAIKASVKAVLPGSGPAAGTVELYDGATLVASKTTTTGTASFSLKPSVGDHSYSATYLGSASYLASATTSPLSQTVGRAGTVVTLTSTYPTTTVGHIGNITAKVSAAAPGSGMPTGSVDFFDDGVYLGTATLVSGKATRPIASLPPGTHTITATYTGDGNFTGSGSTTPLVQTVT